jgi:hypothetical protein
LSLFPQFSSILLQTKPPVSLKMVAAQTQTAQSLQLHVLLERLLLLQDAFAGGGDVLTRASNQMWV